MNSLRFALIGCGRIAGNHIEAIGASDRASVVAVCDLSAERAKAYGERFGMPWYTNYHEMLSVERVDVVCILTPSGVHPTHAIDVLDRYGTHLVVEKPMALRLEDLDRMRDAAARAGKRIFPVYQNRYNKAVQKVRCEIEAGTLGRLVLGTVRVRWCRPQRYYDQNAWRATWALDGGCLTNQGIHYVDVLLRLMGDVDVVSAMKATQLVHIEVEDTMVATLQFASGALGIIEVTTAARPDDFEAEVSVLGENGVAVIAGWAANELAVWTPEPDARTTHSEKIPNAYGLGHKPFFRDVVADLLDGVSHPVSFHEGERAIRLLNAIYRSTEDGAPVRLVDRPASALLGRFDPTLYALYLTAHPSIGADPSAAVTNA